MFFRRGLLFLAPPPTSTSVVTRGTPLALTSMYLGTIKTPHPENRIHCHPYSLMSKWILLSACSVSMHTCGVWGNNVTNERVSSVMQWFGHVLRREDGYVLRREDGRVLRREDGHVLRREDRRVLRRGMVVCWGRRISMCWGCWGG